jgi:uncharacterized protein (TIGR03000 family)
MYSVVLLMAISGGADAPALGGHGCSGYSSCNGGGHGCSGYSSCHGGGHRRGHGHARCHGGGGCNGGGACYGGGCHGGGYGCSGGGCHGGGHRLFAGRGHRCHGGGGCYGGGCHGGYGCSGGGCHGEYAPGTGDKPKDMPKPGDKPKEKEDEVSMAAPATIIVSLPVEAKLSIDDAATTSTGAVRTFVSPALENGRDFHYDLKAEVNGKSLTKRITVRAGEETRVQIDMTSVAAK